MNIFLSTYFIIVVLSYFSIIYMSATINPEIVIIAGSILFVITVIDLYKSKFKFNPINIGILIFTPLIVLSILVQ